MKKAKNIIILILVAIIFFILGFYTACKLYITDATMLQDWNITLPGDLKKQFDISSPLGPHGEHSRYIIYKSENGNAPLDTTFLQGTSSQKNTQMQNDVNAILKRLKIEAQKYPNFSHEYKWKIITKYDDDNDKLYEIFDTESSFAYFIEEIP